jgi:hypothetical protein
LWLQEESLALEYRGQPLSRYDVAFEGRTEELRAVTRPTLFETGHVFSQGGCSRLVSSARTADSRP